MLVNYARLSGNDQGGSSDVILGPYPGSDGQIDILEDTSGLDLEGLIDVYVGTSGAGRIYQGGVGQRYTVIEGDGWELVADTYGQPTYPVSDIDGDLYIGGGPTDGGGSGEFTLLSGQLTVGPDRGHLYVGYNGAGLFTLGFDPLQSDPPENIYTFSDLLVSSNLVVRCSSAASGTFQGSCSTYGGTNGSSSLSIGGVLVNNGRVVADGYGRTWPLDLRTITGVYEDDGYGVYWVQVTNTIINGTDECNGWYAANTGKLLLPPIQVSGTTATYNWGEHPYRPSRISINLVNSMQLTPTAGLTGGNMSIQLLAPDSPDDPVQALTVVGYHPIAVWSLSGGTGGSPAALPFSAANIGVRYDHLDGYVTNPLRNPPIEIPQEGWLALVQWDGSQWNILDRAGVTGGAYHQITHPGVVFGTGNASKYLAVLQPYPGDINLDGVVNVIDLLYLIDAFGGVLNPPSTNPPYDVKADLNADGFVNVIDLLIMCDNWGTGISTGSSLTAQMSFRTEGGPDVGLTWEEALEQVGFLDEWLRLTGANQQEGQ